MTTKFILALLLAGSCCSVSDAHATAEEKPSDVRAQPVSKSPARGPFSDLPLTNISYQQLTALNEAGFATGYPEGTFRGHRAFTRYEFAVALQRVLAEFDRLLTGESSRLLSQTPKTAPNQNPKTAPKWNTPQRLEAAWRKGLRLRQVEAVVELVTTFQPELEMLGNNSKQIHSRIRELQTEMQAVEQRLTKPETPSQPKP
jgi:hypothetical protein